MAQSLVLSDGTSSIDLYNYASQAILEGGHDLGAPGLGRVLTVRLLFGGATPAALTLTQLEAAVNTLRRMLLDASLNRASTRQRQHTLTATPDSGAAATIWDVIGGSVQTPPPWSLEYLANHEYEAVVRFVVEPYARSAEVTPTLGGTALYGGARGITHRFVWHTGATVFSANMAAVRDGSLWQSDKFTATPTLRTPQASDQIYFINTLAKFDRLIFGLRTAASGITWSSPSPEYWNGSAWVTVAVSNPFLNGSNPFGTVKNLDAITFTAPADWATATVNSVTGYALRWRVTGVSSPVAPVITNGPARSHVGLAVVSNTAIPGDVPAPALLHVTNPGATALAGVRLGAAVGRKTDAAPSLILDWQGLGADTSDYIPSGDVTAAVTTDPNASLGERVDVTLAASLSDRAQILNGTSDYISATLTGGTAAETKITNLGNGSFIIERQVKLASLPLSPFPLFSIWDTTDANCVLWFGIDQGKLRGIVYTSGGTRRSVNGATTVAVGEWVTLTFFFNAPAKTINLYYNTGLDASAGTKSTTLRTGITTALRIGKSVGFDTDDSRDGASSETFAPITDGYCWVQKDTLDNIFGTGHYPGPDTKRTTEGYAAGANLILMWEMEDNAASTTITDSAGSPKNGARSAGNTSANTTAGPFVAGTNAIIRALGQTAPLTLSEEWAGTYQAYQLVSPSATLSSLDDVKIGLQWSVGDADLGTVTGLRKLPALAVPTNGWYAVDMGTITTPPVGLYQGHVGSGSGRQALGVSLFVQHRFVTPTVLRLGPLVLIPTENLCEYDTFRTLYNANYALIQNSGLAFDGRGPEPLVYQTTTAGSTVQGRNPYGKPNAPRPRLPPKKTIFIYALPLRPDSTTNVLFANLADSLTPLVKALPGWEAMAAA